VVSGATVLRAALIALAVYVVIVASQVVLTIGLALVVALGLDPLVTRLARHRMGRGTAALLVFLLLFSIVSVLAMWAAVPLWTEARKLVAELPRYIRDLQDEPLLKELSARTGAGDTAEALARDAAERLPQAASTLLGITGALLGSVLSMVTLLFLTLFLLIGLPDLKRAAFSMLTPAEAARADRITAEITEAISYSLLGNVAISVIAGAVVGVAAVIVDAPFPIVLAVIVGMLDLIPQVGSLLAAAIVVVIALAGAGAAAAAVLLVVILIYQQVENYVIQPLVYRGAVELSAFATIAAVMAGGALMGVVGAIVAVPVAASLKIVVKELTAARRRRMAALRAEPLHGTGDS